MPKPKLFKPAVPQNAYLKAGILGFAGSGKTYTATLIAIGLHKLIKSKKPVCFIDTETGSDYALKQFEKDKIKLLVSKSRSFSEMLKLIDEAEQVSDILILDSISAIWFDFMESFKKKKGRNFIQFQDWGILKPTWKNEFTDPRYLNNELHFIICGRAGEKWKYEENEEGRKELRSVGTKMKVESEFGYEPSLLIEMELIKERGPDGKQTVKNYCTVLKDRADILNGKTFLQPTFEDFKPTIEILNLGGEQLGIDLEKDSQDAFDDTGQTDWSKEQKLRAIYLDEIKQELVFAYPGSTKDEKIAKMELLEKAYGTKSWVTLEKDEKMYPSDVLKRGLDWIKETLKEMLSKVENKEENK